MVGTTAALINTGLNFASGVVQRNREKKSLREALDRLARQKRSRRRGMHRDATSSHLDAMQLQSDAKASLSRGAPLTVEDLAKLNQATQTATASNQAALDRSMDQFSARTAQQQSALQEKISNLPSTSELALGALTSESGQAGISGLLGRAMQGQQESQKDFLASTKTADDFDPLGNLDAARRQKLAVHYSWDR